MGTAHAALTAATTLGRIVTHDPESYEARRREARWYVHELWDGEEGIACLCFGHDPFIASNGRYSHADWVQRFYRWPAEAEKLLDQAMARAPGGDVYVTPALRTSQSRKADTAAPGRWLWADVDGAWTREREDKWQVIVGSAPGSFGVRSGGGRHLYVRRQQVLEPDQRDALNRRLALHFGGDSKWDGTALLRLPGRWNNKPVARDVGGPELVRLVLP